VHHPDLVPLGFGDRWLAPLAEHPDCTLARVIRHDGSALLLATDDGLRSIPVRAMDPAPTVGDWLACRGDVVVAVLPRVSLLQRRAAGTSVDAAHAQPLAANIDLVLLVCGLDRPVKPGRIQRSATLAWDAGAIPVVVLTKAAIAADAAEIAARVEAENPGLDVIVTSAHEGEGIDRLRELVRGKTVTMLGESGAGKSSLLNALMGHDVADIAPVRRGDRRGRHTTTARELHPLPGGGVLIDTPGIREVGLWVDPDAVAATFTDVEEIARGCRFADCRHDGEPGCAVLAAVHAGDLALARVESWRALRAEAESAARRAVRHEQRRHEKAFARIIKEAKHAARDTDAKRRKKH
jgi:ribosome biogenesis GTPase